MSGSRQPQARLRRTVVGIGAALVAAAIMAPAASAQNGFTLSECTGEGILGRGASFQNTAHSELWNSVVFKSAVSSGGCGSQAPNVLWDSTGSGNGRAALGERNATVNPNGDRDATVRFAGSDEPPTPDQVSQMEKGVVDANGFDVTAADNGKLHVIPVAIGAITVIVNLPKAAGECTVGTSVYDPAPVGDNTSRPKIPNALLEKAFAGQITTWGELIPTISGSGCADAPIKRAVRFDSSGSTFAFKDFLSKIDPAPWQGLTNTQWPNDKGATAVVRADDSGGGSLRSKASSTDGSISYLALSDARGGDNSFVLSPNATAHDDKFWLPIQRQDSSNYDDPQAATSGFTSTSVKGANCVKAPITGAPDSTFGNWSKTSAVYNAVGYGICTLTYDLAFDDNAVVYCTSDSEQRKARTVRDYLNKAVLGTAGQSGLPGKDYDALPDAIVAISRAGASQIGWNKGGAGRPCTTQNNQPPAATPTPTPGGQQTPPPAPVSNAITIASARVSGTSIRLSLQVPGAGKITVASSTKPKKGKTINLAAKDVTVTKAGAQTVTVSLSSKAKSALKKDRKLKVTLKVTYTPTGGTAKTVTKSVTVKQAKKKDK